MGNLEDIKEEGEVAMLKVKPFREEVSHQKVTETLSVIGQDEDYIYIQTNKEIRKGQVFKIDNFSGGGFAVALDDGKSSRLKPRFPLSETVKKIERHRLLPFSNIPRPLISVDSKELGELEAESYLNPKYPRGSIGWTLTYQPFIEEVDGIEKPLIQYHDYYNRGICHVKGKGQWQPGIYILYATLYDLDKRVPIKTRQRDWELAFPQKVIGCGEGYKKPKLNFL